MPSQHVLRLDDELSRIDDPLRKASLLAKKACYLARVGQFLEAKKIVSDLRSVFNDGRSATATIQIMLAEALLLHFEHLDRSALDRISRAQLLSFAIKSRPLCSLTSAWRAHLEFSRSEIEAMARSLQLSIDNAEIDDYDVQSRIAVILANAYMTAGARSDAHHWYKLSRDNALKSGDQATIDAVIYNRAALNLGRIRAENCSEPVALSVLDALASEVASARNYQVLTNIVALDSQARLTQARLFLLQGDYASALVAFTSLRDVEPFLNNSFNQSYLELECVFCLFNLGIVEKAIERYSQIQDLTFDGFDIDERLVACWMIFVMCKAAPQFGNSNVAEERLGRLRRNYDLDCNMKLHHLRSLVIPQ